jgi:hypothetical protein
MSTRTEPIDTTPWDAAVAASKLAQNERLRRHGLAFARDGTIRCVRCEDVVLAVPHDRPIAIGASVSALAVRHAQQTGCR